jgi:hypothetical protein
MRIQRWRVLIALSLATTVALGGCGSGAADAGPERGQVGFLGAVGAQSPLEDGLAPVTLPPTVAGANLLVAVAMGDGPGPGEPDAEAQHTRLTDTAGHAWSQREHHVVHGSIIDVYTAPATGRDEGSAITSELTLKRGDEGHSLTVLAYRNGRFGSTASRNGSFGIPQLQQDVPPGYDVLTAFGDGRDNTRATPVTGFRPVNVLPVDGGPRGDRDLYQLNQLDPPGSWVGGSMLTGNIAPPASGYWGLVDIMVAPAS